MQFKNKSVLMITAIVVFGVIARLLPHFPNFAPMGAIALFAVAFYKRKSLALIMPVTAWWLSDLFLNNTRYAVTEEISWFTLDQLFSIIALIIIVVLGGLLLKKVSLSKVILGSTGASLVFFVISNFGVWMKGMLYPKTIQGLIECYSMALPFYQATFLSDMIYTSMFFGAMYFYGSYNNQIADRFNMAR
tara:strand:+ start:14483 stop:15052 length:570 start_codon:yes stop_codon:yes gene_type:complete